MQYKHMYRDSESDETYKQENKLKIKWMDLIL